MELVIFGIFGVFGVLFGGGLLYAMLTREPVPPSHQITAKPLGPWSFQRAEGVVSIRRCLWSEQSQSEFMLLELTTPTRLPRMDLRARSALFQSSGFEGHYSVHKRGQGASVLLASHDLQQHMMALARRHDTWAGKVHLRITDAAAGSHLEIRKEGWVRTDADASALADAICGVARAAGDAWDGPWVRLAQRYGLGAIQRDSRGQRRLDARIDGIGLRLEEHLERKHIRVEARARIPGLAALPELRIAHSADAKKAGWGADCESTGNPVLDMCVAVHGAQQPAVRELLEDPALTELLLPVIHGRQGVLNGSELRLFLEDPDTEVLETVTGEVIELARALQLRL